MPKVCRHFLVKMLNTSQVYEQRVGDNEMIVIEGCSRWVRSFQMLDAAEFLIFQIVHVLW